MAIATVILVLSAHLFALLRRPAHLNQIVAELGSIGRFLREPLLNHAGTKLMFIETTDRGYGVFLFDLASRKRILVWEEVESGAGFGNLDESLLGWSPDDTRLAYSRHSNQWELVVADGETGTNIAVMPVDHFISAAVWLTADSLAFVDSERILYLARQTQGEWRHPRPFNYFWDPNHKLADDSVDNLMRWNDHTVAWRQGWNWWTCDPETDPVKNRQNLSPDSDYTTATMDYGAQNIGFTWYEQGYNGVEPTTGIPRHGTTFTNLTFPDHVYTMAPSYTVDDAVLIDAKCSNATLTVNNPAAFSGLSFLVTAGNGNPVINYTVHYVGGASEVGSFVAPDWFSRGNPAWVAHGRVSTMGAGLGDVNSDNPRLFSADVQLSHPDSAITSIDLLHGSDGGHGAIFAVSGLNGSACTPIPVQGYNADLIVENTAGQRTHYVIKPLHDEPPAIWKYADGADSPECVVPNVEKPFRYAQFCPIERSVITNKSGDRLTYYLLSPPTAGNDKKHPMVVGILGIGEMGFDWSANHEAIANCGFYFVSVDRNNRDYSQWGDDALAVYQALAHRLEIDTNNVYLYADSAGTGPVYSLLYDNSKCWRGAVMFSPGGFPELAQLHEQRLFFDCGGGDEDLAGRGTNFLVQAVQRGIPATVLVHPGLGHTFRTPPVERERMREALIFLGGS